MERRSANSGALGTCTIGDTFKLALYTSTSTLDKTATNNTRRQAAYELCGRVNAPLVYGSTQQLMGPGAYAAWLNQLIDVRIAEENSLVFTNLIAEARAAQ